MKKSFISLGLIVAATFALTNCTKEFENPSDKPETAGIPFELTASTPDTKTTNNDFLTEWKVNDALTVIHVEHTEPVTAAFVGNDSFTITAENMSEKKFTGNLTGSLESGKSYDWHVFYPYNDKYGAVKLAEGKIGYTNYGSTCYDNEVSTAQSQKGNDSKAHLAGDKFPLYGVKKNVASENEVSVEMNHLMSVIEVEVTNATTEPVTVTEIHFSAPYYLVGSFYYDTVNGVYEPSQNDGYYNSKTAELSVSNADPIAVGEKAKFYIGIVPVSITGAEDEISMTVITDKGTQIKTKTNPNISFAAGTIKKIAFTYDAAVAIKTVSLPWTEDFSSEDLTNYTIVGSGTKLYDANLAGGTAPELLIARSEGALTANVDMDGYSGNLTLTFKCNYPERISVTSATSGVEISKKSNVEYQLDVDESVDVFELKFTNTSGSNARIDDVLLVKGVQQAQTLTFEQSALSFYIGSDEAAAFTGQVVQGAKTAVTYSSNNEEVASVDPETGVVTLKDVEGTATITARAVATAEYKEATATYDITVSPVQSGGEDSEGISTYQHIFTAKPATGSIKLSDVTWNLVAVNLNGYNSQNYAGVQFGTSGKNGQITLTSQNPFTYDGKSTVKEIRLWLNNGSGTITPIVTINGVECTMEGTITKNSKAGNDYTKASLVRFTPTQPISGTIVIDLKCNLAGYFCAMEIDVD